MWVNLKPATRAILIIRKGENTEAVEKIFLKQAEELGLKGLAGHRSVGGIRASNYNSISLEGAQKLATFIEKFAQGPKH